MATITYPRRYPIPTPTAAQQVIIDSWLASYNARTAPTVQLGILDQFNAVYPALDPFYHDLYESLRQRTPVLNSFGLAGGGATLPGTGVVPPPPPPVPPPPPPPPPPSATAGTAVAATVSVPSQVSIVAGVLPMSVLKMAPPVSIPVNGGVVTPPPVPTGTQPARSAGARNEEPLTGGQPPILPLSGAIVPPIPGGGLVGQIGRAIDKALTDVERTRADVASAAQLKQMLPVAVGVIGFLVGAPFIGLAGALYLATRKTA